MKFHRNVAPLVIETFCIILCITTIQPNPSHAGSIGRSRQIREASSFTGSDCNKLATCGFKQLARKKLDTSNSCFCDDKCRAHDDCCSDYTGETTSDSRWESLKCHRVHEESEDVQMVGSCPKSWDSEAVDMSSHLVELIEKRCRQAMQGNQTNAEEAELVESDPMGMMMPITDQYTGITYANTYCLRCNREEQQRLDKQNNIPWVKPKLVAWHPLLDCNYESADKVALASLISKGTSHALKFSSKLNKWTIDEKIISENSDNPRDSDGNTERFCSIIPSPPEKIREQLRFCNSDTIKSCTVNMQDYGSSAEECEDGPRALVFSKSKPYRVYRNFACALCNGETADSTTCRSPADETKSDRRSRSENLSSSTNTRYSNNKGQNGEIVLASFANRFDISGDSDGIGSIKGSTQCPGYHQVYDPFFMTCRCLMCGLNKLYREGRCIDVKSRK